MATTTVENPDLVEQKKVDGQGRVYLKSALSGKQVRVIVEVLDGDD